MEAFMVIVVVLSHSAMILHRRRHWVGVGEAEEELLIILEFVGLGAFFLFC